MNEYEIFKKWVNSFDEKIYYKTKPPTKKELYEIAIKQEEEIERLKEMKLNTEKYASEMEDKYILEKSKNDKAIDYIETKWIKESYYDDIDNCLMFMEINEFEKEDLIKILKGVDKE